MLYLLHFDKPYKHARHYLGFTESEETLQARLDAHLEGRGARLLEVITEHGIGFSLAVILDGDRTEERRLKNTAHPERICPLCKRRTL